jgi:hypothetical protein
MVFSPVLSADDADSTDDRFNAICAHQLSLWYLLSHVIASASQRSNPLRVWEIASSQKVLLAMTPE